MDRTIFELKNPWRTGITPGAPAITRSLLQPLMEELDTPEVTILLGARATGKTTLLLHLVRETVAGGLALPENVYYFDLDTMDCSDVLKSNRSLIDFIGSTPGKANPPKIVVIDEVQRLDNPGLFLKSVHDLGLPVKLFATGSSSLELRSRIRESLAGRRRTFFLGTLTPGELAGSGPGSDWPLDEYLRWGGYPAVALEHDRARKGTLLTDLLRAYLDRDVEGFLKVERLDAFESLCRILARQAGQMVNLNELAGTLKISRDTADRYLTMLRETFIVHAVPPFFRNLRSELTKMPKVYFADLGLRNLLAGELLRSDPPGTGAVAENFVFILLQTMAGAAPIHYWRTQAKAEVDFVVEAPHGLLAIEVKSGPLGRLSVPTGLRSFIKAYSPAQAMVLNASLDGEVEVNDTTVRFVARERWAESLSAALQPSS